MAMIRNRSTLRAAELLVLLLLCLVTLGGCAENSDAHGGTPTMRIVTTIYPPYDFARAVASGTDGAVDVQMLLPPGSESHDYEPSVADIAAISECDLFICVGGETDRWVDGVMDAIGKSVRTLRMIDMTELLPEDSSGVVGRLHDHSHEEEGHGEPDEHIWTSPAIAAHITEVICDAMCSIAPQYEDSFRSSAEEYMARLLDLDSRFLAAAQGGGTLIFADRFPFRYLTYELGLDYRAAFAGCSSDSEPSLSAIYEIFEAANEVDASVVIKGEFADSTAAELIADACGARVMTLHSCHNVSKEDFERGVTYAELMEENLWVLQAALEVPGAS